MKSKMLAVMAVCMLTAAVTVELAHAERHF